MKPPVNYGVNLTEEVLDEWLPYMMQLQLTSPAKFLMAAVDFDLERKGWNPLDPKTYACGEAGLLSPDAEGTQKEVNIALLRFNEAAHDIIKQTMFVDGETIMAQWLFKKIEALKYALKPLIDVTHRDTLALDRRGSFPKRNLG